MDSRRPAPSIPQLAAIATISAGSVHALPLLMTAYAPSSAFVAMIAIGSFCLGHPTLTIPLGFVLRRAVRNGMDRSAACLRGGVTGLASGTLVAVSIAVAEATTPTTDTLATVVYPFVGGAYGLLTGLLVTIGRRSPR